jgi:hypothetical protein
MLSGEPVESSFSLGSQTYAHQTAIALAAYPLYETALGQTVEQSDRAVVADKQMFGEFADGRAAGLFERAYGEQHLVLLRLQALGTGRAFTEMQKTSDLISKVVEGLVVGAYEGTASLHR